MSTRIREGLIKWAIAIGRRLINWLARKAIRLLVPWMRERVEVFRIRLARAKTDRRQRWLEGRIKRWTLAANWLERHATALGKCARGVFTALAKGEARFIPTISDCERLVA